MSHLKEYRAAVRATDAAVRRAYRIYAKIIQGLVDKHQVILATGQMSDTWQVSTDGGKTWMDEFYEPRDPADRDEGEPLDPPRHPIFDTLRKLEEIGRDYGIGPTNLEMFRPRKRGKKP